MTTADFLQAIIANRDDDGPRLVYADWLEERGEAARAEFIRVQCELEPWRGFIKPTTRPGACWGLPDGRMMGSKEALGLSRRAAELLEKHDTDWLGPLASCGHWVWRRGFPADLTCTAEAWLGGECFWCRGHGGVPPPNYPCKDCHGTGRTTGHADALLASTPLEVVRLTTWPQTGHASGGSVWLAGLDIRRENDLPSGTSLAGRLLAADWPTLRFELPAGEYMGLPVFHVNEPRPYRPA